MKFSLEKYNDSRFIFDAITLIYFKLDLMINIFVNYTLYAIHGGNANFVEIYFLVDYFTN